MRYSTILLVLCLLLSACNTPTTAPVPQQPAGETSQPAAGENTQPAASATSMQAPASPDATQPSVQPDAPVLTDGQYDPDSPVLKQIFVSPTGSDSNSGDTYDAPLKTLTAAFAKIPNQNPLTGTGYHIILAPGEYPCEPAEPDNCQNYIADRHGTAEFPIIIEFPREPNQSGPAILRGGLDLNHVSYLYLIGVHMAGGMPLPTNASGNNLLHLADVDHILLRNVTLQGPDCNNDSCNNLQEVLKVNQAQYLYIENSTIGGAWHTAVDFFSVQYGHVRNNRLHTAGQWCMYIKGGTSYLTIEGNELYNCQLGFQAGQSSNLAVMRPPWLHYEAYGIRFINNVLHDLPGVGMSISGGYNILLAYNTLYHVGYSSDPGYPLVQSVPGERGCNATDELQNPAARCQELTGQGAWGPNVDLENTPGIPSRNVFIYNNLFYNPAGSQTLYTHFDFYAPIARPESFQNLPDPVRMDDNLVLAGNLVWNGPPDHPLGPGDGTGCPPGHPTCSPETILANNTINTLEPQLVNPDGGDYRPLPGGSLSGVAAVDIPDFTWDEFSPAVPPAELSNAVWLDRVHQPRTQSSPPGAYVLPLPQSSLFLPFCCRNSQPQHGPATILAALYASPPAD